MKSQCFFISIICLLLGSPCLLQAEEIDQPLSINSRGGSTGITGGVPIPSTTVLVAGNRSAGEMTFTGTFSEATKTNLRDRRYRTFIRSCFSRSYGGNTAFKRWSVTVQFGVNQKGTVSSSQILSIAPDNVKVKECIQEMLHRVIRFPKPSGKKESGTLSYSVELEEGEPRYISNQQMSSPRDTDKEVHP